MAQTKVTGTVVSQDDGEPVIGASIRVQGTNTGTVTDSNGDFSISVPSSARLEISYIGCKTVIAAAKPKMKIVLQSDAHTLDEFVVTGYGSAKKLGSIAGSVATVTSDKFESRPIANIGDALQGQVAGVQVFTSSGEPTASVSIRLRGVTSINASTTPLFILDGSEISSNTFKALNPEDIAAVTVLKDASATAIYGSRAANGVIILSSKRGKFGEAPSVKVSAQYGVSTSTGDHADMMNSSQWLDLQEMITPSLKTDAKFQAERAYYNKYGISTNWSDVFFGGSAPTATVNVSVTGGSQNTSYLLSFSHYTANGIMDDSNMRRETLRANIETNVASWLKIGANTNLGYTKYGTTAFSNATNSVYNKVYASRIYLPIETYYEVKGLNRNDYAHSTFEGYGNRNDYLDMMNAYNPYYLSEIQPATRNAVNIDENAFVNINPIKGLNIRSSIGLEFEEWRLSAKAIPVKPFDDGSASATESFQRMYRWTVTNTAEYKFDILRDHHFTALIGQENSNSENQYIYVQTTGLTDTRLMLLSNGLQAAIPTHTIEKTVRNSYFGTLSYNYAEKYFVDLSIRRDGSSLFGENNQWATFGAAAVMWNITKENFAAPVKSWLNDLNLKVSYGSTGNSGIDAYQALGLVTGVGIKYNNQGGKVIANAANPDLTWETVKTFNAALTGKVLNRVTFDLEFYNKVTSNMLMDIPYSYSTGFSSGWGNVATMQNRGLDFMVGVDIIKNKDWYWNVSVNGNYNKNKITKLFQGLDSYSINNTGLRMVVGHPYGEFYNVRWKGVDPRDGQNIWLDKNGNDTKVYSDDDKVMIGKNQYAPWSGGLNTTLSWKGLQLDMQFTGMFDRYMINNERFFTENALFASNSNQSTAMLRMWQKPGDITDIPAADATVKFDTHLLENASFVRLKMIQLSYTFPQSLLRPTNFIRGAKVFFIGRNLLTFTGYKGYDPEVDSNLTLGNYPNTRQYSFGVQFTF